MALREDQLWDLSAVNKGQRLTDRPNASHKYQLERIKKQVAEWEARIALARPRCRQVLHLIEKFGGILPFAVACNRHPNHIIYKWLGVTKAGTVYKARWGCVSSMGMLLRLVTVARSYGILLTPEDLFPDLIDGSVVKNPCTTPELTAWVMSMTVEPGGGTTKESMQKLETEIAALLEA